MQKHFLRAALAPPALRSAVLNLNLSRAIRITSWSLTKPASGLRRLLKSIFASLKHCRSDGIGSHARLKIVCRKTWEFDSPLRHKMLQKILVVLGPTATRKSELAVKLAKKFNGEIISADSRQVYKGLNIGTGKITKKEMRGIKHHMLDVVSPKQIFTVSEWQKQARDKIKDILSREKLPIVCGGTAFYIKSVVDGVILPEVPPNLSLRKKLVDIRCPQLFEMLKKLDPKRAKNIDRNNPVRLIRAIEIAKTLGKVPPIRQTQGKKVYEFLIIGLDLPDKKLKEKIHDRLLYRLKQGMIKEVQKLHKNGLSWKRLDQLGLEYRYIARFLQRKSTSEGEENTEPSMANVLETEIWHYVRRQRTWWKNDKRIRWFDPQDFKKIEKDMRLFLAQA